MAQHDYVISNGTGAAVRSDLNNALLAIVSQNSGATEPTTTYAYQWWADTTTGLLKIRNSANNAWITLRELDGTLTVEDGTVSAPGLAFRDDLNTGIWRPGTDQFAISTNGVERVEWGTSEVVFNDAGNNYDFRIEGDNNANLLFVDASADAVGIGTSSPSQQLSIGGSGGTLAGTAAISFFDSNSASSRRWSISNGAGGNTTDLIGKLVISYGGTSTADPMTGTAAAVFDSSGRVGIGSTTPGTPLHVTGSGTIAQFLTTQNSTGDGINIGAGTNIGRITSNGAACNLVFEINGTEKARLNTSGRLLVGTTTNIVDENLNVTAGNQVGFYLKNQSGTGEYTFKCWNATGTGDTLWVDFLNETTVTRRGSIDYNRSAGQVRYNVTSDARLKSNIADASTALNALKEIKVRSYRWTETGYQVKHGFIAQELNEVIPDAVKVGDNGDDVTDAWAVDNAKLVPVLTKALQEAMERIEQLEAKVAALESA